MKRHAWRAAGERKLYMNVCTSSIISKLGTALGLSQITGYSPYMPLLALAVATKWLHFCQVNPTFNFITSDWFLLATALLTAIDLIVDLIPGISTAWHTIHTAITPFIGGFVAIATTSGIVGNSISISLPTVLTTHMAFLSQSSSLSFGNTLYTIVLFSGGFVLAGLVHLHRLGGRAVANVGHIFTLGISNIVVSILEDIVAFVSIILSFLAPLIMLVIVVCVLLFIILTFKYTLRGLRLLRRRRDNQKDNLLYR